MLPASALLQRTVRCAAARVLAALVPLASLAAAGEPVELVVGPRVQRVVLDGAPWTRGEGCIESAAGCVGLWADRELGSGDFVFEARVAFEPQSGAPPLVRIGDCVLGFEGPEAHPFVDGTWSQGKKVMLEAPARASLRGQPLQITLLRAQGSLRAEIDHQTVYTAPVGARSLGRAGFEPARARVRIFRWTLDGELSQPMAAARDEALAGAVDASVARASDWLLRRQLRDGSWRHMSWGPQSGFDGGQTALCIYTLLRAGLPPDHPSLVRALASLDLVEPAETYTAGLACLAYEATRDPKYVPRMRSIANKIVSWQQRGGFGYPRGHENDFRRWLDVRSEVDLSNTQYAILGLRAARHAGIDVADKVWFEALDWTLDQREDARAPAGNATRDRATKEAGFVYHSGRQASLSMTAAGIAIVEMCRQTLGDKVKARLRDDCDRAVREASAWITSRWTLDDNPGDSKVWQFYCIYGLERAGTLLDVDRFGDHDWYVEGAKWLIAKQAQDGSFSTDTAVGVGSHHADQNEADTCFAILFLKRASRATVATGEPLSRALTRAARDEGAAVKLRTSGSTQVALWIEGFSAEVLAAHANAVRVGSVEYFDGERSLGRVEADAGRAWDGEAFSKHVELRTPGEHTLRAVVHVVAADAPAGATGPLVALESKPLTVRSEGVLEEWMRGAVERRRRTVLRLEDVRASATSIHGAENAEAAFDGSEATRWVCSTSDAAPVLTLELTKPVRADRIVLAQGAAARDLTGRYDRIAEVSVRVNRDKEPLVVTLDPDELVPNVVELRKTTLVARLEIRVTKRVPGTAWKGHLSLSEVSLERDEPR